MARVYVYQDGATFYLSRDLEGEEAIGTMTAPMKPVNDYDLDTATKCRRWFVEQATFNNIDYFFA